MTQMTTLPKTTIISILQSKFTTGGMKDREALELSEAIIARNLLHPSAKWSEKEIVFNTTNDCNVI